MFFVFFPFPFAAFAFGLVLALALALAPALLVVPDALLATLPLLNPHPSFPA